MASKMEVTEKTYDMAASIKNNKTAVQNSVNTLKAIKLAIEEKKTEMQGDADFDAGDIAVATNALNAMHTLIKSIFGD